MKKFLKMASIVVLLILYILLIRLLHSIGKDDMEILGQPISYVLASLFMATLAGLSFKLIDKLVKDKETK